MYDHKIHLVERNYNDQNTEKNDNSKRNSGTQFY